MEVKKHCLEASEAAGVAVAAAVATVLAVEAVVHGEGEAGDGDEEDFLFALSELWCDGKCILHGLAGLLPAAGLASMCVVRRCFVAFDLSLPAFDIDSIECR